MTNLAPKLFEAFDGSTRAILRVGTFRQCSNTASKTATGLVRRMRPMLALDIGLNADDMIVSGFMQPLGHNKYTGRYEYYC